MGLLVKCENPQGQQNEQVMSSDNVAEKRDGLNPVNVQPPADNSVPSIQFSSEKTQHIPPTPKQHQPKTTAKASNRPQTQLLPPYHQPRIKKWTVMRGPRLRAAQHRCVPNM